LANIFMLAWPYGYPMIMSSFRFSDSDQGPPSTRPVDEQGHCSAEWVCEHRDLAITAMIGFRNQTLGQPVTGWAVLNPSAIAFSRGDLGFVAINAGATATKARVRVGLAPGRYLNILAPAFGVDAEHELTVGDDQELAVFLPPMSAIAILAGASK
jgi:alpha-amylase